MSIASPTLSGAKASTIIHHFALPSTKLVAKEVNPQRYFSLEVKRCSRKCFFPRSREFLPPHSSWLRQLQRQRASVSAQTFGWTTDVSALLPDARSFTTQTVTPIVRRVTTNLASPQDVMTLPIVSHSPRSLSDHAARRGSAMSIASLTAQRSEALRQKSKIILGHSQYRER
jgi:hypothetical protein